MNSLSEFSMIMDHMTSLTSLDLTRVKLVPGGLSSIAAEVAKGKFRKIVLDCLKISGMDDVLSLLLSKQPPFCKKK